MHLLGLGSLPGAQRSGISARGCVQFLRKICHAIIENGFERANLKLLEVCAFRVTYAFNAYIHAYIQTHTCIDRLRLRLRLRSRSRVAIHTYIHTHTHTHAYIHTYIKIQAGHCHSHGLLHRYIYTYMHTQLTVTVMISCLESYIHTLYVYIYMCVCVCTRISRPDIPDSS